MGKPQLANRKISESLFQLAKKRDAIRRVKFIPQQPDDEIIKQSPVFKNPQKWIKKLRMIDETNRLQTYKPLETSAIAHVLSSPQRMTHASRTVVPRSSLIPLRLMENPFAASEASNIEVTSQKKSKKKSKNLKLEYIMVPFHPMERKVPEDPVIYYPNSLSLFDTYLNEKSPDVAKVNKFSFNPAMYPNIENIETVGWNRKTSCVILKILEQSIIDELNSITIPQNSDYESFLVFDNQNDIQPIMIIDKDTVINVSKFDVNLLNLLYEKIPSSKIPTTVQTSNLIRKLLKYTSYINN